MNSKQLFLQQIVFNYFFYTLLDLDIAAQAREEGDTNGLSMTSHMGI